MANVVPFPNTRVGAYRPSAELIADRVAELQEVLIGLAALRELGGDGAAAVSAVLAVPLVNQLRLSWELLEALMQGEGLEPEDLLSEVIDEEWLGYARSALLGEVA